MRRRRRFSSPKNFKFVCVILDSARQRDVSRKWHVKSRNVELRRINDNLRTQHAIRERLA